jgi:hypothetical protein
MSMQMAEGLDPSTAIMGAIAPPDVNPNATEGTRSGAHLGQLDLLNAMRHFLSHYFRRRAPGGVCVGTADQMAGRRDAGSIGVDGKRTGKLAEPPSFMFPIILAIGGAVTATGVIIYMCCFKKEEKPRRGSSYT